jgi:hypothetical protein
VDFDVGTKAKDPSRGADFLAKRLRQTSGRLTRSNLVMYGKARLLRGGTTKSSLCISTRFAVQHWQKRCFKLPTITRRLDPTRKSTKWNDLRDAYIFTFYHSDMWRFGYFCSLVRPASVQSDHRYVV